MSEQDEPTDTPTAPTSFNGKLQHFAFDDATSVTSNTSQHVARSPRKQTRKTTNEKERPVIKDVKARVTKTSRSKKPTSNKQYADPSVYAHLKPLTDILEPNLICVFVGFNPGVQTATSGHAYAHKSNQFWKLMYRSGITPDRQLQPEEDVNLPRLYALGNTNLVSRPTRMDGELSAEERLASVPILDAKIRKYKPEAVCIVGKGIWENIWKARWGRKPGKAEFRHGWQDERQNMGMMAVEGEDVDEDVGEWEGARVFVATSTSGLDAGTTIAQKEAIWRPLGDWVQERRRERAAIDTASA